MSKIAEVEENIIKYGLTEQNFSEYKIALKRVHDNFLKRQHCYNTAIQMPDKCASQAIELIEYGLESFEDDWFSTYTSHLYIGKIYERVGEYQQAYSAYLLAVQALPPESTMYVNSISGELMWMRLHIDKFRYSEELEKYYNAFNRVSEFERGIITNEFKLCIGKIIISLHNDRVDDAKTAYARAVELLAPNVVGRLQSIFNRHHYKDTLHATPESRTFIKSLKRL